MIFRSASVCWLAIAVCTLGPGAEPAVPSVPAAPANPPVPTVIESGTAEMVSTEKESTFTFQDHVTVTATNMKLLCDRLVVVARRTGDPAATLGNQEKFKSLIATGNVRIIQNDREATCGRAEVFPDQDKVVLSENPRVRIHGDDQVVTGPRMELYRGERRAIVLSDEKSRPKLFLPPLKDLGYEKEVKKKSVRAPAGAEPAAVPKAEPKK